MQTVNNDILCVLATLANLHVQQELSTDTFPSQLLTVCLWFGAGSI